MRNALLRRSLAALLWAVAVSTWASIAHHFFRLPDVGLVVVAITILIVMTAPQMRLARAGTTELDSATGK